MHQQKIGVGANNVFGKIIYISTFICCCTGCHSLGNPGGGTTGGRADDMLITSVFKTATVSCTEPTHFLAAISLSNEFLKRK